MISPDGEPRNSLTLIPRWRARAADLPARHEARAR